MKVMLMIIVIFKIITANNNNNNNNNDNNNNNRLLFEINQKQLAIDIVFLIVHSLKKMRFNSVFVRVDIVCRFQEIRQTIPNTRCHI